MRNAIHIVEKLQAAGYEAVFAGGCVRDYYLDREPQDYDVATDATPEQIEDLFEGYRLLLVGKAFGAIKIIIDGYTYDVATYRRDGQYSDHRRPDKVEYTNMEEDAKRRDITINGIFYDPIRKEVFDYVGGLADLQAKKIRMIGSAQERINEDALRMLRVIRFAVRYGFVIETGTLDAIVTNAELIQHVSPERIFKELSEIIALADATRGFTLLLDTGLLDYILPELSALKGCEQPPEHHPEGDVWSHTMLTLEAVKREEENPSIYALWGALLHDIGKPITKCGLKFHQHHKAGADVSTSILQRLHAPSLLAVVVAEIVYNHMTFINAPVMRESRLKRLLQLDNFSDHLLVHKADCIASSKSLDSWVYVAERWNSYTPADIKPHPFVNGNDLIQLGFKPGPKFRDILDAVMTQQLEGQIKNKDEAISYIEECFDAQA